MWWNDRIYFLDFGMVGEVGPEMREQLMLLLHGVLAGRRRASSPTSR